MHEQQDSVVNNFTMPSSLPISVEQIENTSEINNEFMTEFMTTIGYYKEDVSNDTISSQNFTLNNG